MSKPCADCPFRKDSIRGWLADYTPMELHQIVMNELPFPCHMAMQEEDVPWEEAEDEIICAGSLRYMKKNAKKPRRKGLAELVNKLTPADCDNILSGTEFLDHHQPFKKGK